MNAQRPKPTDLADLLLTRFGYLGKHISTEGYAVIDFKACVETSATKKIYKYTHLYIWHG